MKIAAILILSFLLFFNNLGSTALWDPDEPRQAIMAREMIQRGNYVHPYLNGIPYLEKPPFYPWMIIVASKINGKVDEFSSRLPAAISATILLFITYYLGCILVDKYAGFLSALILATNYQFLSNARESVMDMTFALFIGLTIFCNFLAIKNDKRFLFIISFIPASLGILTKGPAGLAIPALITFFYLISQKKLKKYFFPLVAGCIIACLIASIWFFLAGEEYFREFILRQNITRYTKAFDHKESFFYYFHKLFFNFLPWSILLPFSVYYAFKKRIWLPLIWFVATFLFYEFSKSKRAIYLLSLYPACALLCGIYIKDRWHSIVNSGWRFFLWLFGILITILPVTAIFSFDFIPPVILNELKKQLSVFYIFISLLSFLGAIFCFFLFKRKDKGALAVCFLYLTVMGVFYNIFYMPLMDRSLKSPKLITDKIKSIEKYSEVYSYGFSSSGLIFYAGRPIKNLKDIKEIKDNKNGILLIVEDNAVPLNMKKELDKGFTVTGNARYEKDTYTFYEKK
ncbi:MAG TPA: glycosyltransferase family 39 protein [Syntrophorhabdaceae bacterium]|nr:glycosyltransferase family 39 protein [Syntrophorhabdaceae bacterium]